MWTGFIEGAVMSFERPQVTDRQSDMNTMTKRRRGFTLIEVLVVIAIISVLVALILPAVHQAREAARRTACKNNLKQLALAMHNYETTYRVLPPGYVHKPGPAGSSLAPANHAGMAWGAMLLPQLEQPGLYRRFNSNIPVWDLANREARETQLPVFLCPSDPWSENVFVIRDDSTNPVEQYAAASYAANWGPATATVNLDDTPLRSQGVFYRNSRTRVRDITDGLSNTLAVGERTNGPLPGGTSGGGHASFETSWVAAVRDVDDLADDHGHMVLFETQFLPNQVGGDDKGLSAPHIGMCQFALCDGSVRAISENIDADLYNALGTRRGREPVGEF